MTGRAPGIDTIIRFTCASFGVSQTEIVSPRREARVTGPRMVGYWLARALTAHSASVIGRHFGDRDHTTIMHGVRRVAERMEADPQFRAVVQGIRDALALPPGAA